MQVWVPKFTSDSQTPMAALAWMTPWAKPFLYSCHTVHLWPVTSGGPSLTDALSESPPPPSPSSITSVCESFSAASRCAFSRNNGRPAAYSPQGNMTILTRRVNEQYKNWVKWMPPHNKCRPTTNAAPVANMRNRPYETLTSGNEQCHQDALNQISLSVCVLLFRTSRWMKIWLKRRQRRHWGAAFIWECWTWVTTCCMSTASASKPGPVSSTSIDSSINPSRAVDFKNNVLQFPCQPQEGRLVSFGILSPFVILSVNVWGT